MPDRVCAGSTDEPQKPALSDAAASLLGCGCLLAFAAADLALTAGLVYLLIRWLG